MNAHTTESKEFVTQPLERTVVSRARASHDQFEASGFGVGRGRAWRAHRCVKGAFTACDSGDGEATELLLLRESIEWDLISAMDEQWDGFDIKEIKR